MVYNNSETLDTLKIDILDPIKGHVSKDMAAHTIKVAIAPIILPLKYKVK